MATLNAFFFAVAALCLYLAILAVVVVIFDCTLRPWQKVAQCLVAILMPLLGPITILFMAHTIVPGLIRWVPWPFKKMVSDEEIKRYDGPLPRRSD